MRKRIKIIKTSN